MFVELIQNNFVWNVILSKLLEKYDIENKLIEESKKYNYEIQVLPKKELVFNAFNHFDLCDLKVVIIGQDPYINENQAMGLSFSVPNKVRIPPSLRNVYKCIEYTCNVSMNYENGDLTNWVKQGVLLLNKTLTVFEKKSNSHKKIWKGFVNDVIKYINNNSEGVIFVLWGNDAKSLKKYIDVDKHFILEHTHPSPLARNSFTECNHFTEINNILNKNNKTPIDWCN
jgi:uracil-DNA glycosylase